MGCSMGNLKDILRFGWPYLRRYRGRFFLGILLGLVFSGVSGALVPAASVLMKISFAAWPGWRVA